jgi:hypothetical protein
MYSPDSSLTAIKLKENKEAAEDMTFLNWSPCLLIRFTSLYYILPNGCVWAPSNRSRSWARLSGELAREGARKTFFFIIVTFLWKSLTPPSSPPPDVFHNSTKGRLSFPYISLQTMHSHTRLHARAGKCFEIPFVYTLVSLLQIEI